MTAYSLFISLVTIQLVVGMFGGYAGYTAHGVPHEIASLVQPNLVTIATWVWNSVNFMWDMITFDIDGMPAFINMVFLLMAMSSVFLLVKLVRGS